MKRTIPKTIHYCWFGGSPLGEKELACIESWKKFLPDYEIKRWDENNYDIDSIDYVQDAYRAKKWAYVSDYARFDILHQYGGVYFDTDVELICDINDLIEAGPYMGYESNPTAKHHGYIAPGLGMAANKGMPLYRQVLDSYLNSSFYTENGGWGDPTVVIRVTNILLQMGLTNKPGIQEVAGIKIYPAEYFNPKDPYSELLNITDKTRSIHHYSASWLSEGQEAEKKIRIWLANKGVPGKMAYNLSALFGTIRNCDFNRIKRTLTKRLKS